MRVRFAKVHLSVCAALVALCNHTAWAQFLSHPHERRNETPNLSNLFGIMSRSPTPPRYRRVMLMNGLGMQIGLHIGALAGARASGRSPDIIVGTCGGSVGAAMANRYATTEEMLQALLDRETHQLLLRFRLARHSRLDRTLGLFATSLRQKSPKYGKTIPEVYSKYILEVPHIFSAPRFDETLEDGHLPVVILAAKARFSKAQQRERWLEGEPLYQEVYFTDARTAPLLKGFDSDIYWSYPDAAVARATETIQGARISDIVRSSIADPHLMEPHSIAGQAYLTGALNLFPRELLSRLAEESSAYWGRPLNPIEDTMYFNGFKFSLNQRVRQAQATPVTHFIDFSDVPGVFKLDPGLDWESIKIVSRVPNDYITYRDKVLKQFRLGFERALEAFRHAPYSSSHIRKP